MSKYGKKAKEDVEKEMHNFKRKHKWKNAKRAIAVGLSNAREEGAKVPRQK